MKVKIANVLWIVGLILLNNIMIYCYVNKKFEKELVRQEMLSRYYSKRINSARLLVGLNEVEVKSVQEMLDSWVEYQIYLISAE